MQIEFRIFYFIILTWSLCDASNDVVCQLFDQRTKTVEKYCKWYSGGLAKNCSLHVTINFPTVKDDQVVRMKIAGCNESTVLGAIQMYPNIEWLDLSFSGYESLDWLNVKSERLKEINASINLLSEVPQHLFQNLPELVDLDLSRNKISYVNEMDLSDARKLRKIHLSHNNLEQISDSNFKCATDLEYIDLRTNKLSSISSFSNNNQLRTVRYMENPIREFNCSFLLAARLISFHFSWSSVLSFNGQDCADKRIHVVSPNGNGNVDNNDGISITAGTRQHTLTCHPKSFTSLNNFVAGRNAFDNVADILNCFTDIHYMDLGGNYIGAFRSSALKSFYFLERLNLSDTALLYFDVGDLRSPSQLKSLDLSQNNLKDIRNIAQANYLNELNLNENRLQNTPEIVQHLSATIQKLKLSGNFMGTVTPITFRRFTALQLLALSNTSLSISQGNPFERLVELRSLDVSHNNLSSVNFTQLAKTLNRLVEFRAVDCHIENVAELLSHLSPIRILDLSLNTVGYLDNRFIENLISLEELRLNGTGLFHFDAVPFQNLKNLRTLVASHNELTTIDVHLLPKSHLAHLDLQANELRRIDGLNQSEFKNLSTLAVSQNQLECDHLEQLISNTKGIRFIDDPLNQKQQQTCDSNGWPIFITIVLVILMIIIVVLCVCFIIRLLSVKSLKTVY